MTGKTIEEVALRSTLLGSESVPFQDGANYGRFKISQLLLPGDVVNALNSSETAKPLAAAKGKALKEFIDRMARDFGRYDNPTSVTLSQATAGKYIDVNGAEVTNASYGISAPISLNMGDILLVPSANAVLAACSVVSQKTTSTYNKPIIYTPTYDALGRIATMTADYDSSLVYTAHYTSDEASTPDYWIIGGSTVAELPATHSVTENICTPLVKQSVAAMPDMGYYVYLAPQGMEVVISGFTATVNGGVCLKVGWGIFKNIASNFVGVFGQRVIAEALNSLMGSVNGILSKFDKGLDSLTVDALTVNRKFDNYAEGGNDTLQGAGAPAAATLPKGWDQDKYGTWQAIPARIGQFYIDTTNKIAYIAVGNTAVADWVRISNA